MSEHQQQPKAHPQRCETCSHYGGHICYQQHNRMSNIELTLIEMVGCASHSSLQHPVPTFEDGNLYSSHREWQERHDSAIERKAREDVLDLMGNYLAEHIYTCRGISAVDSMKMAKYIGSLRSTQQQAGDP